ncbi:MAG: DNA repair protein RadC [Saprospiraceae bacterium]
MSTLENKSIKNWAEDDRPREKLVQKGKHALSNSELLAIILGSGSRNQSAVDLAKEILESCQNNLIELSKLNIEQLSKFKGVGPAKAIDIIAALELGNRRQKSEALQRKAISCSKDSFDVLRSSMQELNKEESWVIFLNRSNAVISVEKISSGGITSTVIDPRVVFKKALELQATSIILSHNHPSGQLQPSQADRDITKKIKQGGLSLDIQLLDHLIISERGYYSFADEGQLSGL